MKALALLAGAGSLVAMAAGPAVDPLPARLSETGLHDAASPREARAGLIAFEPRYPLWTDGARKRRWIRLPPGTAIDASDPDAWDFPPGTRIWKEFGYERPLETRLVERLADGSWRYATYVWNAAATEATLAPEDGIDLAVPSAPGGVYTVPSRTDCRACHEGPAVPVLGFSAVQLGERLASLVASGAVRHLRLDGPPRIAASNDAERAALGYLHGNCGHCHNDGALDGVGLVLAQKAANPAESRARVMESLLPRLPDVARRFRATNPMVRMPPLGTRRIDPEGLALVARWLDELEHTQER